MCRVGKVHEIQVSHGDVGYEVNNHEMLRNMQAIFHFIMLDNYRVYIQINCAVVST